MSATTDADELKYVISGSVGGWNPDTEAIQRTVRAVVSWLAEHDAKVRAETFRGAAQSVRAEARWQAEQKVRGAVQRSGAETAVDRLLVIEKLFHEQADQVEREAGLK